MTPSDKARILIVEDDAMVAQTMQICLEDAGFDVVVAHDGAKAREEIAAGSPSLVTIDLNLPGEDGNDLVRTIRSTSQVPIMVVSGKDKKISRIVSLEIGADDFVAKPFDLDEFLARVRALLRRSRQSGETLPPAPPPAATATAAASQWTSPSIYSFAGWTVDTGRRLVRNGQGHRIDLTSVEFDLFIAFLRSPQKAISRAEISESLPGDYSSYGDRAIDIQVARLRKKVEDVPEDPALIKTVRGVGYLFTEAVVEQRILQP